ncbi:MAG: hypothetical protein ACM4AI_14920 [Acidobacteriota bacterium]
MTLSGTRPAASWRAFGAVGLAALLCVVSGVNAQTPPPPPAQNPPAQQPPAAAQDDPLKLKGDQPVLIVNQIDGAKAADFEAAWAAIREKLLKSDKPEVKALGESLGKLYKVNLPADQSGGLAIYVFQVDQPSSTLSYHPVKVLYETGIFERADADQIFAKLKDGYKNIQAWPLTKIGS